LIPLVWRGHLPDSLAALALGVLLVWIGVIYPSSIQTSLWSRLEPTAGRTHGDRVTQTE